MTPKASPTPAQAASDRDRTRCLIADNQAMVREGFAAVLAAQPGLVVVGQAANGAETVRQARQLRPDIVLMDVRMPVMDGLAATRQILGPELGPHRPRVLMLTTFDLSRTLVIAEQTTKTDVGRILAKLDLRDRAQAVVLAYESGLIMPGE
jgi:DNA-binding NarL/FixJ family response regulator